MCNQVLSDKEHVSSAPRMRDVVLLRVDQGVDVGISWIFVVPNQPCFLGLTVSQKFSSCVTIVPPKGLELFPASMFNILKENDGRAILFGIEENR